MKNKPAQNDTKPAGAPEEAPQNSAPPSGSPPEGMPPTGAGGPPPWAKGMSGPPPWAKGMGGPPPGVSGPPPWANGAGGPPPGVSGPPPWAKGKGKMRLPMWAQDMAIPPEMMKAMAESSGPPPWAEEMRNAAPDFKRWRTLMLKINIIYVAAMFIAALIITVNTYIHGEVSGDVGHYFFRYLILPTVLTLMTIGAEVFVLKKCPQYDFIQDTAVMTVMSLTCIIAASAHYSLEVTTALFCVPVLSSVVFYNKRLTYFTAILNLLGLAVAMTFRHYGNKAAGIDDPHMMRSVLVAIMFIMLSCQMAQVSNMLMNEQKSKLFQAVISAATSRQDAIAASKTKSDFLANMSHEIRTPINAVLGMNEMILREEHDPTIREYALNIQNSGTLLLSIINDVLDISKIESGKVEILSGAYDISSLISDCYNMSAAKAKGKDLTLNVVCNEMMPRMLSGDEARIRQIIVNLLTNAVKYTEAGTVTFTVDGEQESDKYLLKVSVKDTGIGISEKDLGSMFEQFSRFDMKRNRNIEGTGLGLPIVKHLIDLMEGEINVQSKLGEGSEFSVSIPQEVVDYTPVGKVHLNFQNAEEYDYVCTFEAPLAHILAVDDLPVNLMVITNMLKDTKVKIDKANSGKEAIALAEQNHYDIILMDHMMPEMDGIETYAKLRADEKSKCGNTPVIMLTANALAGVREQYMDKGFADYISKPVQGAKLEAMIMKYLPEELINKKVGEEKDYVEAAIEKDANASPLLEALPQLNMKLAMQYCCGSTDLFYSILKDYAAKDRPEQLQAAFDEERYDDYRINVHSLKSTSLTIGLEGLSERARASEFAVKSGSFDFVKMNHPELMNMYTEALGKIREFVATLPPDE